MDVDKIVAGLHPLERKALPHLKGRVSLQDVATAAGMQEVEVMRAFQWMQNKKLLVIHKSLQELIDLDENGTRYAADGLPEKRFIDSVTDAITQSDLATKANLGPQEMGICLGLLKRLQLIDTVKDKELQISLTDKGKQVQSQEWAEQVFLQKKFPIDAAELSKEEKIIVDGFSKRKQILKTTIIKNVAAELTEDGKKLLSVDVSSEDVLDRITPDVLKSGSWKDKKLRSYDVSINVPKIYGGKKHPVNQSIDYIKKIWLDMGFTQMTGDYVQTAFWDLDALFVPQDHPAREMQDTFYLKDPKTGTIPKELTAKVQAAHEHGGDTGSTGWGGKWSAAEAMKLMLITHDTFLSAQTLANTKAEDLPIKTFQIMKVFRNEALSWKSLFEFYQVGGIVVDPDANLKHLKGYLKQFFSKMGFPDVRMRPAHFPYTEPSLEIDVWHPIKESWVEVAGSGIFRPEMVKPLLGIDVPVIAWGIGLERSLMEYYGLTDVRDVYKNDIKQLRETKLFMK